jgi:hypothetical protein
MLPNLKSGKFAGHTVEQEKPRQEASVSKPKPSLTENSSSFDFISDRGYSSNSISCSPTCISLSSGNLSSAPSSADLTDTENKKAIEAVVVVRQLKQRPAVSKTEQIS